MVGVQKKSGDVSGVEGTRGEREGEKSLDGSLTQLRLRVVK
jgi:hypothetical protein